jgi:cytoskeletal protein CcmA (bactofilin family)
MWWEKEKEEKKSQPEAAQTQPPGPVSPKPSKVTTPMAEAIRREPAVNASGQIQAIIGRSLVLKGELSANEDLVIDGQFEGTVNLQDHCLTIGANGKVKAEVRARQVVILGSVNGNVSAREKIEVRKTAQVTGDLTAASVAIEEGAYFKGSIDILRNEGRAERPVATPVLTAGASKER